MKKAQVWTVDFIIGISMFIILVLTSLVLLLYLNTDVTFQETQREGIYISNVLISEGSPSDWNTSNVILPGLLTGGILNQSKLDDFASFSYDDAKAFFSITNDFAFFFKNASGAVNLGSCVYGYNLETVDCQPTLSDINYDNFIVINRFVPVNATIMNLVLYVWT